MTTLLIATPGGHLKQLHTLWPRLGLEDDALWVTCESAQARSLLDGEQVVYATATSPRDLMGAVRNFRIAQGLVRDRSISTAISTGSSLAVPFLLAARVRGATCHYIESATRVRGPSTSGRLVSALPTVRLYTQHRSWATRRWQFAGSVFDGFRAEPATARSIRRVVVSLGSAEDYPFARLLRALVSIIPADADVLWQTGSTPVGELAIEARPQLPARELEDAIADADVVVAHAGTGTALTCLDLGKLPVLVPRRKARSEHIDDHQLEIAGDLGGRGLALVREPEALRVDDLVTAAGMRVVRDAAPAPFALRR
jgi:UDP-N-acetylglucosamine transferase subunit ALG13